MIIYCIENKINGQKYVGATGSTLKARMSSHKHRAFTEKAPHKLYKNIRKCGWDSFKYYVLEEDINDRDDLMVQEKYWIDKLNTFEEGYNSTSGGEVSPMLFEEVKDNWRRARFSPEVVDRLSDIMSSKEYRDNMSKATQGNRNGFYGRTHSAETKRKISEANMGREPPNRRAVLQYEESTGKLVREYKSVAEACASTGISRGSITHCLRGRQQQTRGFKWEYKTEENVN